MMTMMRGNGDGKNGISSGVPVNDNNDDHDDDDDDDDGS